MIANNRGSKRLVGAASLRYRMPAFVGFFRIQPDIAHWTEQQPSGAVCSGFDSHYPTVCKTVTFTTE
jgi:hypothetical protein